MVKLWRASFFLLGIIFVSSFAQADMQQMVQEPKGKGMDLVEFKPKLSEYPFSIKYPASWYAREEYQEGGVPSLFITREPVRTFEDKYLVGFAEYFFVDYKKNDTRSYEEHRKSFTEALEKQGSKILSVNDIKISNKKVVRIDCESAGKTRTINLYVGGGDHLITLIFEAPSSEYDQYKNIFESMIGSLLIGVNSSV